MVVAVVALVAGFALGFLLGSSESSAMEEGEGSRSAGSAGTESAGAGSAGTPPSQPDSGTAAEPEAMADADALDLSAHSITDPASIWILVNKQRPIEPAGFAPDDLVTPQVPIAGANHLLRQEAAAALEAMAQELLQDTGRDLAIVSGYRSAEYQRTLYERYVTQYGQESADTFSARPGYSEHQTGLAADVTEAGSGCDIHACFADTASGKWLAENAWRHGFIVRYPEGAEARTGYTYEPWHLRYVGADLAGHMHTTGAATLEEALGEPDAPAYR